MSLMVDATGAAVKNLGRGELLLLPYNSSNAEGSATTFRGLSAWRKIVRAL